MKTVFSALAAALLVGCGADPQGQGAQAVGGCDAPKLFAERCVTGCHTAKEAAGSLDLESPNMGARLVGKPATCGGVLVDPKNPRASVLYRMLGDSPPCGARMPKVGRRLDNGELSCVEAWIGSL